MSREIRDCYQLTTLSSTFCNIGLYYFSVKKQIWGKTAVFNSLSQVLNWLLHLQQSIDQVAAGMSKKWSEECKWHYKSANNAYRTSTKCTFRCHWLTYSGCIWYQNNILQFIQNFYFITLKHTTKMYKVLYTEKTINTTRSG